MRHGLVAREVGPTVIGALVVAMGALWLIGRPAGESTRSYFGQFLGAQSILLLSIGLVPISTLPWVEEWFDGIDRAAIWHRRVAIAGIVLLAPHILLSSSPHGTSLGVPLGAIGAIGLTALPSGPFCRAGNRSRRRRFETWCEPRAMRRSYATFVGCSAGTSAGVPSIAPPGSS